MLSSKNIHSIRKWKSRMYKRELKEKRTEKRKNEGGGAGGDEEWRRNI